MDNVPLARPPKASNRRSTIALESSARLIVSRMIDRLSAPFIVNCGMAGADFGAERTSEGSQCGPQPCPVDALLTVDWVRERHGLLVCVPVGKRARVRHDREAEVVLSPIGLGIGRSRGAKKRQATDYERRQPNCSEGCETLTAWYCSPPRIRICTWTKSPPHSSSR